MNETIAFRPEGRASIKRCGCQLHAGVADELEQLHPALDLLARDQSSVAAMISLSVVMTRACSIAGRGGWGNGSGFA